MHHEVTAGGEPEAVSPERPDCREFMRTAALRSAIAKRSEGVPTYSVPEAAALLSISQEYLYRLIQSGGFPSVQLRIGSRSGRYVVPAKALDALLDRAVTGAECVDAADWTRDWARQQGGAA